MFMLSQARIHPCEQPDGHEVQHDGIDGVQQQIGQMVAERIEPPKEIIDAEGKPGQRVIVTHVECSEHPSNIRPVKTPVEWIFNNVPIVIPVDKLILQYRIKGDHSEDDEENRDSPLLKTSTPLKRRLPP